MLIDLRQRSIQPITDLREMLREHVVTRSLAGMEAAAARRTQATASPHARAAYRNAIRAAVRGFYGDLPAGAAAPPPLVTPVSVFAHPGFRVENVRFESWPGWEVNASVFVPAGAGPFPVVICPCGHGPKTQAPHQARSWRLWRACWARERHHDHGLVAECRRAKVSLAPRHPQMLLGAGCSCAALVILVVTPSKLAPLNPEPSPEPLP